MVGGAVRDRLLGQPVNDHDWVVVGTTPEAMQAQGFVPVGKDFPVFLHPQTHEEYALARTERKSGRGYHGFSPKVYVQELFWYSRIQARFGLAQGSQKVQQSPCSQQLQTRGSLWAQQ